MREFTIRLSRARASSRAIRNDLALPELRPGVSGRTLHSETLVTADRLDPLRRDRNDGNSAYWPPRGTSARSRARARASELCPATVTRRR